MKKLIVCILAFSLLFSTLAMAAFADAGAGEEIDVIGYSSKRVEPVDLNGMTDILNYDPENPAAAYKITQAAGVVKLGEIVNGTDEVPGNKLTGVTIYLAGDINMGLVSNYAPIGIDTTTCFSGTFDGQGHVIDNLKVNTTAQNAGLFGCIVGGTVKNLVLGSGCSFASKFNGEDRLAAIVGLTDAAILIDNCYNMASVSGTKLIAGFVGRVNSNGNETNVTVIKNSTNAGAISGLFRTGGFVGVCGAVVMENCRNTGSVYTMDCTNGAGAYHTQHAAGGLIGESWGQSITVTGCINNGAVRAAGSVVGGLIGTTAHSSLGGTITSSFNYGTLTMDFSGAGAYKNGILGHNSTAKEVVETNSADHAGQEDASLAGDIETITPNFIYHETVDPNADPNAGEALDPYDDGITDTVGVVGYSSLRVNKKDLTNIPNLLEWTSESTATEFQITTPEGIRKLSEIVNGTETIEANSLEGVTIYLANELDMIDITDFWAIGWNDDHPFSGTFDGQGYVIDNFQIYGYFEFVTQESNNTEYLRYGMFGTLKNGNVKNVVIGENSFVYNESRRGHLCAGGIAGMVIGSCVIDNCYVMAAVSGIQHIGGIVGQVASFDSTEKDRVIIRNCTVSGRISAEYTAGGIVGDKYSSGSLIIKNCRSIGIVENTLKADATRTYDKVAGGVVGRVMSGILAIRGFVNNAEISSKTSVGGVVGNADSVCEVVFDSVTMYGSMIEEEKAIKFGTIIGIESLRALIDGEDTVVLKFGEEDATLATLEKPTLSNGGNGGSTEGGDGNGDQNGNGDQTDNGDQGNDGNQGNGETITTTPAGTDAPVTNSPVTDAPTTNAPTTEPKKGCSSTVSGFMILLVCSGAALAIGKKKND